MMVLNYRNQVAGTDPGFAVGGAPTPLGEGNTHLQRGCFSVKANVKMRELGLVGDGHYTAPWIRQWAVSGPGFHTKRSTLPVRKNSF